MEFARSHGIPVPELFDAQGPDMVLERVDGPTMLEVMGKRPDRTRGLLRTLAGLHEAVHGVEAPGDLRAPLRTRYELASPRLSSRKRDPLLAWTRNYRLAECRQRARRGRRSEHLAPLEDVDRPWRDAHPVRCEGLSGSRGRHVQAPDGCRCNRVFDGSSCEAAPGGPKPHGRGGCSHRAADSKELTFSVRKESDVFRVKRISAQSAKPRDTLAKETLKAYN